VWLTDCWIHGLRRFGGEQRHRVRIDAKLVCLIGANEAGKSTILYALDLAQGGGEIPLPDRTRREDIPDQRTLVELRFRLDEADQAALSGIARDTDGPPRIQWFTVVRLANGERGYYAEPKLIRDRQPRRSLRTTLAARALQWWPEESQDAAAAELPVEEPTFAPGDPARVSQLIEALTSDESTLAESVPQELRELANEIEPHEAELAEELRRVTDLEAAQPPDEQANDLLFGRMPQFVRFDDDARILESEYDLNAADTSPGKALGNFIRLAGLNVGQLLAAVGAGDTGQVQDIKEAANRELERQMQAWQQDPPIRVSVDTEGALLRIHVKSGTGPTMQFRERSDGLRQFVALVALTAQHDYKVRPTLLIDEVETHLHYNAQADLIDVLTTQTAAAQVIYTTHSAACLPQDLALGVRVVEGIEQKTASTVRQNIWQAKHPGLGSLLMAMGASSLVYVTLRPGVIAEGVSDLILLPTLIREATGDDSLGFAVVPGASTTPPDQIAGLGLQGVRTVWVFDADDAGRKRREYLTEAHIPGERILLLTEDGDLEIEDLVAAEAYVEAVGLYLTDIGAEAEFSGGDLPAETCRRPEMVDAWCEARQLQPPSKTAIANKIIELAGSKTLLDAQQAETVRNLQRRVKALFES
jgi:AAA domain, putative AbiEii toxin, Type IV TA system